MNCPYQGLRVIGEEGSMDNVWKVIEKVSYGVGYFAGWILLGIIALTMVEVLTRYVMGQPLILCDEFGGYSLFAITFLGLAYCAQGKGHIRITFIVERMNSKVSSRIRVVTLSLVLLYALIGSKISGIF